MFSKGGMLKKAQEMQKKMMELQNEISNLEIEGSAGGDMVVAKVSGDKKIISIKLHDDIMSEDKEMLEDMVLVAVNQAIDNVDKISKEKMGSLTGGMNIPGLF